MNRDEAKQLLPIIQAFADGKTIQREEVQGTSDWLHWVDITAIPFVGDVERYRIKPEPVLRPWRWEEAPKMFVLMRDGCHCVASKRGDRTGFDMLGYSGDGPQRLTLHDVCHGKWLRIAEDGTEHPCGVMEPAP